MPVKKKTADLPGNTAGRFPDAYGTDRLRVATHIADMPDTDMSASSFMVRYRVPAPCSSQDAWKVEVFFPGMPCTVRHLSEPRQKKLSFRNAYSIYAYSIPDFPADCKSFLKIPQKNCRGKTAFLSRSAARRTHLLLCCVSGSAAAFSA